MPWIWTVCETGKQTQYKIWDHENFRFLIHYCQVPGRNWWLNTGFREGVLRGRYWKCGKVLSNRWTNFSVSISGTGLISANRTTRVIRGTLIETPLPWLLVLWTSFVSNKVSVFNKTLRFFPSSKIYAHRPIQRQTVRAVHKRSDSQLVKSEFSGQFNWAHPGSSFLFS